MQSLKAAPAVDTKQASLLRNSSAQETGSPVRIFVRSTERHPVQQFRQLFQQTNLTNKYYLAGTARTKLAYEVEEVDRNLLRLVGHANFLDRLQDEIDTAERLHETRHQARLVGNPVSSRKGSIVWADDVSDEEQTSSDSEGDEDILELVRIPTRYQLSAEATTKDGKVGISREDVGALQGVKVVQVSTILPRIVEENEDDVSGVTGLLQTFKQEVAV